MISFDEALDIILKESNLNPPIIEKTIRDSLVGYVIAKDIFAQEAVPAYRASIVDGYAIVRTYQK
jgi:gephyrin